MPGLINHCTSERMFSAFTYVRYGYRLANVWRDDAIVRIRLINGAVWEGHEYAAIFHISKYCIRLHALAGVGKSTGRWEGHGHILFSCTHFGIRVIFSKIYELIFLEYSQSFSMFSSTYTAAYTERRQKHRQPRIYVSWRGRRFCFLCCNIWYIFASSSPNGMICSGQIYVWFVRLKEIIQNGDGRKMSYWDINSN